MIYGSLSLLYTVIHKGGRLQAANKTRDGGPVRRQDRYGVLLFGFLFYPFPGGERSVYGKTGVTYG